MADAKTSLYLLYPRVYTTSFKFKRKFGKLSSRVAKTLKVCFLYIHYLLSGVGWDGTGASGTGTDGMDGVDVSATVKYIINPNILSNQSKNKELELILGFRINQNHWGILRVLDSSLRLEKGGLLPIILVL